MNGAAAFRNRSFPRSEPGPATSPIARFRSNGSKPSGWRAFPTLSFSTVRVIDSQTDAMEGTGNVLAVRMRWGMGREYHMHSNVQQIREEIEWRNQLLPEPVEAVQKPAQKWPQSPEATVSGNPVSD